MKRVIVHIDRLVLAGFRREDQRAIATALQRELLHVLADPHVVSRLSTAGNVARLQVAGVRVEHGAKAQRVGKHVARGIGREIVK